ncbi:MAG: outer membrane protein assembly factor BamE [Gammaproteobacteria bacterium]|jgi:outer membrane protein assembly factor BamE|nr:outer membrane protein assembly factor BamE [Gammaproteobacteria bacterium]MBT5204173.1 outer membrane protein assembly factor BamE [Gammaproteobacteria bacterium]MBT5602825.1 outer membrane protein assembly factor BamE [Gammaproteobacteria bacterium]MBT6246438.1 outer membrane protein assembly factor BamE [Gammaproteobacteria bacterium]
MKNLFATLILLGLFTTGCSTFQFPWVYRLSIQQGNIVSQEMIDKLKPGMSKSQIQFILGNPILEDALDQDRWNYIYSMQIPGRERIHKELVIYFKENRLSHFEGDYVPSKITEAETDTNTN